MVPDVLQGKESVGFNTATCNFMTNKLWQRPQDLSERLHPESLFFATRNLDISCLTLHLAARTELPSRATQVADQQMNAVGKQTHCPHSDGQIHTENMVEAAHRENSGGNLAMNAVRGSSHEGAQPAGMGAVNNKLFSWGLMGKLMRSNKRQWLIRNTRIRKSLERLPAMCFAFYFVICHLVYQYCVLC